MQGVVISNITDNVINDVVVRSSGGKQISIDNNIVSSIKQNINLKALEKPVNKILFVENYNIGVIDIETFLASDSTYKVYALGFKTNLDVKPTIYYIDEHDLNSSKIVLSLVNELLRAKYGNITLYCHNLGGYDIVFILKVLYTYNDENPEKKYNISCILRDDKIIKVKISKDKHSFVIFDSFAMLPDKLDQLGKDFKVHTIKTKFPYKFAVQDNLFYEGSMPSIDYYDDITENEYSDLYMKYWTFRGETIRYLTNDLCSLHEVLIKANKQVFLDYNVNMSDNITISGLAVRIFLKDYYNNNIPLINKPSIYKDIKEAYYGGMTEVYRPWGRNLFYYDVNSLYPYVALQDMPGLTCSKLLFFVDRDTPDRDIDNLFGFFYCRIETPHNNYLGVLPVKSAKGLIFPLGIWEGWYFSEELKFAKTNGYKIKVLKGYTFNREVNVFKGYVDKVYKIKSNPINPSQGAMAKSLLNNLLGRFGINLEKPVTEVLSYRVYDIKSLMHKITSHKQISEDKILVSYAPKLDYDIIKSHNLDFLKVVNKYKNNEFQPMDTASVVISAAITAYARIHISKLKLDILNRGGELYYSDTDSIVTNIRLPESLVSPSELGLLKLVHELKEGIFISNKIYWMENMKSKYIIKAKGIRSKSLSFDHFVSLLNNQDIKAVKRQSKIDWKIGHVIIEDNNNVNISSDSYTKRVKIYNHLNRWINTKPVFINNIDKNLVVFKNLNKSLIVYKENTSSIDKNTQKPYYVLSKSVDLKSIMIFILIITILSVSSVAYLIVLAESMENVNECDFGSYQDVADVIDVEINKNNDKDKPSVATGHKADDNNYVYETRHSYEIDDELTHISVTEPNKSLLEGFDGKIREIRGTPDKTLYEGFIEATKVQEKSTQTESDLLEHKVTRENIPASIESPRNTTTSSYSPNSTLPSSEPSPAPAFSSEFSPKTLTHLEEEIRRNGINLERYNSLPLEDDVRTNIKEKLLDERSYLLDQKAKHLDVILHKAKNVPLNDVDTDALRNDISELKKKVDDLDSKSECLNNRSLK